MSNKYRDVKSDILDKIAGGVWSPGDLIPNEIELAEGYGCARATVNRAMRELASDGIIERRRKAGTRVSKAPVREARFVIPLVRKEIEDQGAAYRYALVRKERVSAPDWLRARLRLPSRIEVMHLLCMHYSDGNPYQFEERWISLDALPQAAEADFDDVGPNEWLVAEVPFSNVEISFLAVQADAEIAEHLGCNPGDALFRTERSTWWDDRALTFVRLTFRRGHRMATRY